MPRSKRNKKISLTKTKKKGLETKQNLIREIRKCVQEYRRIFIFSFEGMRNAKLKEVRKEWRDSRFFIGKNKAMAVGLGRTKETEVENKLHKVSKYLIGQCGLLFTNREEEEVLDWFSNYREVIFAKSGNTATETVTLPVGPLSEFSHSIEPHLRSLGMPTCLKRGVVNLYAEFKVCKAGEPLEPHAARILALLGYPMGEFKLIIKYMWSKDGTFKKYGDKKSRKTDKVKSIDVEMEEEDNNDKNGVEEMNADDVEEEVSDNEEEEEEEEEEEKDSEEVNAEHTEEKIDPKEDEDSGAEEKKMKKYGAKKSKKTDKVKSVDVEMKEEEDETVGAEKGDKNGVEMNADDVEKEVSEVNAEHTEEKIDAKEDEDSGAEKKEVKVKRKLRNNKEY